MDTRKAAVVGLGIGMGHVAGYLASPHAELVAVADAWEPRRAAVGGTFAQGSMLNLRPLLEESLLAGRWEDLGARVYDSVDGVARDPEIDLVSLCTPDDTHEEYAVRLLAAGKDLVLEKPMALSMESALRIRDAARTAGRRIAINYEMRINPVTQKLRELIASGELGEVQAFNLQQYRAPFRRDKYQKWIQHKARSGGMIVEETCHWFDLARFLTGREVTTVHCVTTDRILPDFDYEDVAFVQGTFDDGAILQVGHSLTGFDFSIIIQVHGTRGTAWCGLKGDRRSVLDAGQSDYLGIVAWGPVDTGATVPGTASPAAGGVKVGEFVTFGDEALEARNIRDHVVSCVDSLVSNKPFLASDDDGLRALAISLAAVRSAETGAVEDVV